MNINPQVLLKKGWEFVSGRVPESNELLSHVQQIPQNQTDTTAVMDAIEQFFSARGNGDVLNNNVWKSCKGKSPDELFGHLKKCGLQSGKIDFILKLLGGNN